MSVLLTTAAAEFSLEQKLVAVLLQLCVIILAARVFANFFRWFGQPAVVGEILAGLILGPSVLGAIPQIHGMWQKLFMPAIPGVADTFMMLSQLGLIFLLFLIGLEFDFRHLKTNSMAAFSISLTGVIAPFVLGFGLAQFMAGPIGMADKSRLGFSLFMGTAMSITAIPILGRIMMELGITRTKLGAIVISAAAIDDGIGWIMLASVSALVKSHFRLRDSLAMLGETVGFALLVVFIARPLLGRWSERALRHGDGELSVNALAVLIVVIFLCAIATSLIGIFAIFGAFILGATLSDREKFRLAVGQRLRDFVTAFFLPIFFTYTGLRTDVGSVGGGKMWLYAAMVCFLAVLGKFGGCSLAARFSGFSTRESACAGVMMNTRALMELIVINVGYDLGVIPRSVFCMLVLMAVLTTIMTTPLLLRLVRGTHLEPLIRDSGFLRLTRASIA